MKTLTKSYLAHTLLFLLLVPDFIKTDRNHFDIDCKMELRPTKKKEEKSVHSSGPHFDQDMWQDNRSPEHLRNVMHDYGNTSPKEELGAPPFLLIPCKGLKRGGVHGDYLQLKPPVLKRMSWITCLTFISRQQIRLWSPSVLVLWSLWEMNEGGLRCMMGKEESGIKEKGRGGGLWGPGFNSSTAGELPLWWGQGKRRYLRAAGCLLQREWWSWLNCCRSRGPWWCCWGWRWSSSQWCCLWSGRPPVEEIEIEEDSALVSLFCRSNLNKVLKHAMTCSDEMWQKSKKITPKSLIN